jgi:hypothetical protein
MEGKVPREGKAAPSDFALGEVKRYWETPLTARWAPSRPVTARPRAP